MPNMKNKKEIVNRQILREIIATFKWNYQYTKRYSGRIVLCLLLGLIATGLSLVSSVAFKFVIDSVVGKNLSGVRTAFAATVLLSLCNILINSLSSRISLRVNIRITNSMIADAFQAILNTRWEDISVYQTGDLLNRLHSDVRTVSGIIVSTLNSVLLSSAMMFGAFAVIVYYDPTFALLSLLSAPFLGIIYKLMMKRIHAFSMETKKIDSELMSFNAESLKNIQILKAFAIEPFRVYQLRRVQSRYEKVNMDFNKISLIVSAFMSILGMFTNYACYAWGIYRLWTGGITFGTMTLFLQLSSIFRSSFSSITGIVPNLVSASTSTSRIMEVMRLSRDEQPDAESSRKTMENCLRYGADIAFENVEVKYKNSDAIVENVHMLFDRNDTVALIGSSGSGKTTIFRALLGLIRPSGGKICVRIKADGFREIPVSEHTRSLFAYVPQGNTVFSGTIADNLRTVKPDANDPEIVDALKAACAYDFVAEMENGINTYVGENGIGISEGQAQRIAIARAIICGKPIILFDEATSSLDIETERNILQNVKNTKGNRICIFSTHRFGVLEICDKVYHVADHSIRPLTLAEARKICTETQNRPGED